MEQVLSVSANLGYWALVKEYKTIPLNVESLIGKMYSNDDSPILDISSDVYVPTEGDKIYMMPGVNIPRVKFKNLAFEKKVKSVRDPKDANIIFANKSSIYKIANTQHRHWVTTERFKELLKEKDFSSKLDAHDLSKIESALEFYTNDYIILDRNLANECSEKKDFTNLEYSYVTTVDDEWVNAVKNCQGKMIYNESGVVDLLNGDSASIIDADMFKQLSTMFDSTDSDNHILAMEIMANCKYTPSLAHMLLLFKDYSHKMHNCHTKNHVNFKSLTGWIDRDIMNRNSLDTLCEVLKDKDQFTPDRLDILLNHSHQDILSRGESKYFTIKVITLNPEYTIPGYDYKVIPEVEENFDEAIENAIDLIEPIEAVENVVEENILSESELNNPEEESETIKVATEEDVVHDLYGVDNDNIEVTLPVETVLINQKIEKNESDDFEWF